MKRTTVILTRYILYFLLFAAIILLLFTPVYWYIGNFSQDNELSYIRDKLEAGSNVIDTAVTTVVNASSYTFKNLEYTLLKYKSLREDHLEDIKTSDSILLGIQKELNGYLISQPMIADAGILISDDIIITRSRNFISPDLNSVYEYIQCQGFSFIEWLEFAKLSQTVGSAKMFNSAFFGKYEAITVTIPWLPDINSSVIWSADIPAGTNISSNTGNVFFANLRIAAILPLLADWRDNGGIKYNIGNGGEGGYNDIIDAGITSAGYLRISDSFGNLLYETKGSGGFRYGNIHIISYQSPQYGFIYEIGVPDMFIKRKMRPVMNLFIIFGVLVGAALISSSLIFAYMGSKPMRKLLERINSTTNIKDVYNKFQNSSGGFLSSFHRVYSDLAESISTVDNKLDISITTIEYQAGQLKGHIFEKALRQGLYSPEDYAVFKSAFPNFPEQFQLALIRYEINEGGAIQETVAFQLRIMGAISQKYNGIFAHCMDSLSIVLLLPLEKSGDDWYIRLQELRSELNQENEALLSFSLSDVFDKMPDLSGAWRQVRSIHVNPVIDTIFSIGQTNDVSNQESFTFNAAGPQMIYDALSAGSGETACSILEEYTALIKNPGNSLLPALVYNMIHDMLVLVKLENPVTLADIALPEFDSGQKEALFSTYFPECFRQIGERIKSQKDKSFTKFGQKTLDFINEHLYDPNLYSAMVTEKFDISKPTLQKLVKSMTGQTFLAYVENQRLTKSYEMLCQGTEAVQDIARACGFSNANTFYKAFKRKYGFSPSAVSKR